MDAQVSLVLFVVLIVIGAVLPDSTAVEGLSRLAGLILMIIWYLANGKKQCAYVLARYGKTCPRKGWTRPLGIAVACLVGFATAAGILGVLASVILGTAWRVGAARP